MFQYCVYIYLAYITSRRRHIHDYSTGVEQRSEPDSMEAKTDSKRLVRLIMTDFVSGAFCGALVRVHRLYHA